MFESTLAGVHPYARLEKCWFFRACSDTRIDREALDGIAGAGDPEPILRIFEQGRPIMNHAARAPEADPSPSEVLAGFTADLDLRDVPDAVVRYARVPMLDLLGTALAGVDTEEARAMPRAAEGFAPAAGPCGIRGAAATTTAADP